MATKATNTTSSFLLLSFVIASAISSSYAFLVTSPGSQANWTNVGPQTISWSRVSSDARNFSLVLTNQNRELLDEDIVIATLVNAVNASHASVSPPYGGWPSAGDGYRVNLVKAKSAQTIYAQSNEFWIVDAGTAEDEGTGEEGEGEEESEGEGDDVPEASQASTSAAASVSTTGAAPDRVVVVASSASVQAPAGSPTPASGSTSVAASSASSAARMQGEAASSTAAGGGSSVATTTANAAA